MAFNIGSVIVTAICLSILGSVMVSGIFSNFSAENYTGSMLSIVMPFVPVIFGVGILYFAGESLGIFGTKK